MRVVHVGLSVRNDDEEMKVSPLMKTWMGLFVLFLAGKDANGFRWWVEMEVLRAGCSVVFFCFDLSKLRCNKWNTVNAFFSTKVTTLLRIIITNQQEIKHGKHNTKSFIHSFTFIQTLRTSCSLFIFASSGEIAKLFIRSSECSSPLLVFPFSFHVLGSSPYQLIWGFLFLASLLPSVILWESPNSSSPFALCGPLYFSHSCTAMFRLPPLVPATVIHQYPTFLLFVSKTPQ